MPGTCRWKSVKGARLNYHVDGIPAKGYQSLYRQEAHEGQGQFTDQHAPQVSQDTVSGNGKEYKRQPYDHGKHILEKGG